MVAEVFISEFKKVSPNRRGSEVGGRMQNLADQLPDLTGAIVSSTASRTAMTDVSRSILMALNVADVRIAGVVEDEFLHLEMTSSVLTIEGARN